MSHNTPRRCGLAAEMAAKSSPWPPPMSASTPTREKVVAAHDRLGRGRRDGVMAGRAVVQETRAVELGETPACRS